MTDFFTIDTALLAGVSGGFWGELAAHIRNWNEAKTEEALQDLLKGLEGKTEGRSTSI